MKKGIAKSIEAIREELKKPIPDSLTMKEKKMAKKTSKKKGSAKKSATKRTGKKSTAKKKTGKKSEGKKSKSSSDEITLTELADEAKISGQKARQKLRAAGIEREDGKRWSWSKSSKALKAARKALGL